MQAYDWLSDLGMDHPALRIDLVEVMFKGGRKALYRNVSALDVQTGDYIIVEADCGTDLGTVHLRGELVRLRAKSQGVDPDGPFPNLVRTARLQDIERWEANRLKEAETFHIGRACIDQLELPMKLVDVEWQLDHRKVTFYFTADHRVDFRQLVRDLASRFRTRVELRQIGARDEAARLGGLGTCGRELCCSTWLQSFKPVTTQAAKVQHLPLNPIRLSGQCGRLKCCLNYELEQYMRLLRRFPRVDTTLRTHHGEARITKIDIFRDRVQVVYANGHDEDTDLSLSEVRRLLGLDEGAPARRAGRVKPPSRRGRQGKPRRRPRGGSGDR
ncbi:MAG: regulatory iron-sulfur-containing complex subunit RicT [Bacteroidota bacterium]